MLAAAGLEVTATGQVAAGTALRSQLFARVISFLQRPRLSSWRCFALRISGLLRARTGFCSFACSWPGPRLRLLSPGQRRRTRRVPPARQSANPPASAIGTVAPRRRVPFPKNDQPEASHARCVVAGGQYPISSSVAVSEPRSWMAGHRTSSMQSLVRLGTPALAIAGSGRWVLGWAALYLPVTFIVDSFLFPRCVCCRDFRTAGVGRGDAQG